MNIVLTLFGEGDELNLLQMGLRAFAIYLIALILIQASGIRTLGKKSPFDIVVSILLGAVLSRAVVGASPFWSTVAAGAVIVLVHRVLAWLCIHNAKLGIALKGREMLLYADGQFIKENMNRSLLTDGDLMESVRLQTNCNSLENIEAIYLERSGRISVIKKN